MVRFHNRHVAYFSVLSLFLVCWLLYSLNQHDITFNHNTVFAIHGKSNATNSIIQNTLRNYQSGKMYSEFDFTDVDGGVWKQGWDVQYDTKHQNELNVFVMPFSHIDVGWVKTIDTYYSESVKPILDNVINFLSIGTTRRFVWSETVFLYMWWKDERTSDSQRNKLQLLLQSGRFEILAGGWVVPDEASTGYESLIQQLVLGHQWIRSTINQTFSPKCGFNFDDFGYGSTMPEILYKANIRFTGIQRVHYIFKKILAKSKDLEFKWTLQSGNSLLTHIQPFYSYDIPHTCGPDPKICCSFDFERSSHDSPCPWNLQPAHITKQNIHYQCVMLTDQYRKKAELYRAPVVLVPLGDDFRYRNPDKAFNQIDSYERLMNYINSHYDDFKMKIQFGTISEYYEELQRHTNSDSFSNFDGDLFPYADIGKAYWTGYFSTRPYLKSVIKEMQSLLRSVQLLHYFSEGFRDEIQKSSLMKMRDILSVTLHHDSITGTSPEFVIKDLFQRIDQFYLHTTGILKQCIFKLLNTKVRPLFSCSSMPSINLIAGCAFSPSTDLNSSSPISIILYNPLEFEIQCHLLHFQVNTLSNIKVIEWYGNKTIKFDQRSLLYNNTEVSFLATVPAFSARRYIIQMQPTSYHHASNIHDRHLSRATRIPQSISNDYFSVTIENQSTLKIGIHKFSKSIFLQIVKYSPTDSVVIPGAYISNIGDIYEPFVFDLNKQLTLHKGSIYSYVSLTNNKDITVTVKLLHCESEISQAIQLDIKSNVRDHTDNVDVALRMSNYMFSFDNVYTDSNGYKLIKRLRNKHLPGQANIYPFTRVVRSDISDTTMYIVSGQPRSLYMIPSDEKSLNVILHRSTAADDIRGMNERLVDIYEATHTFQLYFEGAIHSETAKSSTRVLDWEHISRRITHPLLYFIEDNEYVINKMDVWPTHLSRYDFKSNEDKCHLPHIVILSQIENDRFLLVLRAEYDLIGTCTKISLNQLLPVPCNNFYQSSITGQVDANSAKYDCSNDKIDLKSGLTSFVFETSFIK
ncbi:hypothetical protein GJ496_001278 [Pomphorhynchus laevis]|nr:hypothetical protein GJ496_001278 [Pomphorhynchus laevis]